MRNKFKKRRMISKRDIERLLSKSIPEWKALASADHYFSKFDLDEACANQGQRFVNWAELAAIAVGYADLKEEELNQDRADMELDVRENFEDFDLVPDREGKLREAHVKAIIRRSPKVKRSYKEFVAAKAYNRFFENVMKSFDQRKTMIRMMGDLVLGEYKADVEIRDNHTDDMRKRMASRRGIKTERRDEDG